jgi:hypothetical protein
LGQTFGQDKGVISGDFQGIASVFDIDSRIGADQSPQYLSQMSSAEAWLFLNYQIKGFKVAARFDLFNNSNLLNPTGSYSNQGLGFWQVSKKINKLDMTVGSFYEQFGSGLIFRAYEQRLLGIDYAMQGVRMKYHFTPDWYIKGFTGWQKGIQENRFGYSRQIVKGVNSERVFYLENAGVNLTLGGSMINRTLDNATMDVIATEINSYDLPNRFDPKWNVYAYQGYFSANYKGFSAFAEYTEKSKEAIRDESGRLKLRGGNIIYAGGSWSKRRMGKNKKFSMGLNVQYRRIDHFPLRVDPNAALLNGLLTYQPSLTRQGTYRMLARYNAPAQELGEQGIQAEAVITPARGRTFTLNYSNVRKLNGDQLFREYYIDYSHKFSRKFKAKVGVQSIFYNQNVYEGKANYPNVYTITPFQEVTYKINKKNSLRLETQYLRTKQDLGSFINAVAEWNISPHYSFAVTDMVNVDPVRQEGSIVADDIIHYYSVFGKYTAGTTAFTLAYIKQVEGVNCTGGICRLEPAFSGYRFTVTTNF